MIATFREKLGDICCIKGTNEYPQYFRLYFFLILNIHHDIQGFHKYNGLCEYCHPGFR